jgi:hypothetical protein
MRDLDEVDRQLIAYRRLQRGGADDLRVDSVQAEAFELRRDLCQLVDGMNKLETGEEPKRPTTEREAYERFLALVELAAEGASDA